MLWAVIGLKALLIVSVLGGAGLALARATLRPPQTHPVSGASAIWPWALLLLIVSLASLILTIWRLGVGFQPLIFEIVLTSPPGYQTAAFILGAVLLLASRYTRLIGALLCCLAFGISGHSPSHADWLRPVISLHVLIAAWWTGGIICLLESQKKDLSEEFAKRVTRFGKQALPAIGLLIAAGLVDGVALVSDWPAFLASPYARILALKLGLVALILALAAYNRQRLTPGIQSGSLSASRRLKMSMRIELVIITGIALTTAVLTTSVSPFVGAGHAH